MQIKSYTITIEGHGPCQNGNPYEDAEYGARALATGLTAHGGEVTRAEIAIDGRSHDVLELLPAARKAEFAARAVEKPGGTAAYEKGFSDAEAKAASEIAELKAKLDEWRDAYPETGHNQRLLENEASSDGETTKPS